MILLDTHVLLWWKAHGERLSARARREIDKADRLLISPVSFWEIGMLVDRGRVALDRDVYVWASDLMADDRLETADLSTTAGIGAGLLPSSGFEGDPADALLYATARELSVPFATKDRRIRTHATKARDVKIVW